MNTIIVNNQKELWKMESKGDIPDFLIDEFSFNKFKMIFEYGFKATVELECGTKKGKAVIVGKELQAEDIREKHEFSWDFINHEYNKDDVMYDRCKCFEYDRESYIKNEIADDFQIEAELSCIIWACYYIMTAKREKSVKPKGTPRGQKESIKESKKHYDKKVFLLDEIIEYVNEIGISQNTHTGKPINCPCWSVRGHYRHYKSGKVIFVKEHEKGKQRGKEKPRDRTYTV